jgi:hypothetical protein
MAYARPGRDGPDYFNCSYGASRLSFRGPARPLDGRYCAVLGGTETFGRFVARPFPDLLEQICGLRTVNLGCANAGPDAFLQDAEVLQIARRAVLVVLQLPGAQNLTNPLYSVHPRRNDRFIRATEALRRLYPEVDFTEFAFTRHLLQGLSRQGPKRFCRVRAVLQATWAKRMAELIERAGAPVVALWMAGQAPPETAAGAALQAPHLVTRTMVETLRPLTCDLVEAIEPPPDGGEPAEGMMFGPLERAAAAELPGPAAHERTAAALAPVVARLAGAGPDLAPNP